MANVLDPRDRVAIGNLRRSDVELTLAGLKRCFNSSLWIGRSNYYASDIVSRLREATPTSIQHKRNLAQYIAASVALHANDGWSYLGRAVSCVLTGDTHRSLHLAYYAELRAAMSLLAGSGIGIFERKHFIVTGTDSTSRLRTNKGTHQIAWLALEEWARLAVSGSLFAELVRPEGHSLNQWFQTIGGANAFAPQALDWFMQWGMDLRIANRDRDARNESSYRPDGIPISWNANAGDCLNFVREMWELLEPSTLSRFEKIDRHILRLSIERYYLALTGREPASNTPAFEEFAGSLLSGIDMIASAKNRMKKFLCRKVVPTDPLVFRYSTIEPNNNWSDALSVISRALLLLRLASGSAYGLLEKVDVDSNDLAFWWESIGENRGIWLPGNSPNELLDLWTDVEVSLSVVTQTENSHPNLSSSFRSIASHLAPQLSVLASHERVGIWSLCPT